MMERKKKVVQEMVNGVQILLQSQGVVVKHGQADLLASDRVIFSNGEDNRSKWG
jgi:pyruvate/2-oxoglutarate dehydrogenase complex dihydrolipoamide dehydrogenase (E3) component